MDSFAAVAVAKMNTAIANTGLDSSFRYRLAGTWGIDGNGGTDLEAVLKACYERTTYNNVDWSQVAKRRDTIGADVVTVLIDIGNPTTSTVTTGIGYCPRTGNYSWNGWSDCTYNCCAISYVANDHTMTHETGHNMGCGHADTKFVNPNAIAPGPGVFDYSSGYHFTAGGTAYHSIMAYNFDGWGNTYKSCPYFSSPEHKYNGVTVGDASHNNTKTLKSTFAKVASFRALATSTFSISPLSLAYTSSSGSGSLSVSANSSWTATASDSWITFNTTNGSGNGTVNYSVSDNPSAKERIGTITVRCGAETATHTVKQSAEAAKLNISPTLADYPSASAEGSFSVSANYSWSVTKSDSWISLYTTSGSGNGTVSYSITENTGTQRSGTITVKSGSLTATHTITQAAQPTLNISPSETSVSAAAANGAFSVTSDSMWTVSKSSTATWLTLNTTSGSGNGTVSYSVAQNTGGRREGYIFVKSGTVQRMFTVRQKCANIVNFSESTIYIPPDGGSGTVTATVLYDGSGSFQAPSSLTGDWIAWSRTETTVTDGYEYTYSWTAEKNSTGAMRDASLDITLNGTVYRCTFAQDPAAGFYRITYKPGAYGTGDEISLTKKAGELFVLKGATYTRSGYTQTGWATTDGGGKAYVLMSAYTADKSIVLYPYWEESSSGGTSCTVTLLPGRYGTGDIQTLPKYSGKALTLPGISFTRDGYVQSGWATEWTGTAKVYDLGGAYTLDADAKLYPYWEAVAPEDKGGYDVGFDASSGWPYPICLSSKKLSDSAYAPTYVFGQADGLILNYLYKNFSDTAVNLSDRLVALYDVNDNCVASALESLTDIIPAGQGMWAPNWNYSEWMASLPPGNYVMEVVLDPYDKLNDPDDSNNWCDEWFAVKAPGISLADALDCHSLHFILGRDGCSVFAQTSESVSGGASVQFGPQAANCWDSALRTQVTGPGTLTFRWKATSEDYKAFLGCYVDENLVVYKWAQQQTDWEEASVSLDGGSHEVKWLLYSYDPSMYYLTAGWLDSVVWNPTGRKPVFTVDTNGTLTGVELNGATELEIPSMVNMTAVRAIGACVLTNTPITSVSIPSTVVSIERQAFYNNPCLSGVTIPGSVKYIYDSAFNACSALKSVVLEEGIEAIGNYAFYNCDQLASVRIPASVTLIDQSPFGMCPNLRSITVASGNRKYEVLDNALVDKAFNTLVQYPSGRPETEYTVPSGITGIGYDAFDTVSALTKIRIPGSVGSLGRFAFYNCGNLGALEFLGNAPAVGDHAFYGVPSTCKVLVSPQSTGWNVAIPGTWQGLPIAYSQDLARYAVEYHPGASGTGDAQVDEKPYGVSLPLRNAAFTRTGYVQTGWSTSDGGAKAYELGASYTANAAITLYPFWTAAEYSVAYELDGGTPGTTHPSSSTYDVAFMVSAPVRSGYAFTGWLVSGDLDAATAYCGSSAEDLANAIGNDSQLCFNGSDCDVWFLNLASAHGDGVVLAATWEEADDGSRDIGFYAPASKGWEHPLFLSSTNVEFLAYAPESQFEQFTKINLNFCAVNWSRAGTAILQSTLLTISDENGNVLEQAEPIQRYTLGAFGYQEFRSIPLYRYMEGIAPGRYKLTAELDPNRFLNDSDRANNTTSFWFTITAPSDPVPALPEDASRISVATALSGSADGRLIENITDIDTYNEYRTWAHGVKGADGKTAGAAAVKASDKAWFSFAIDSSKLVEREITKEDVKIEDFSLAPDGSQFDVTIGMADVEIGDGAKTERLKTVLGIEASTTIDNATFSSDGILLETAGPDTGKIKLVAKTMPPKTVDGADTSAFFIRATVNP